MALISRNSNVTEDWEKTDLSILEKLRMLLKTSQWSDCTFYVGEDKDVQVFKAHKLILASSSPVFEAMWYGSLAEEGSINISDIEPSAFKTMLHYIYTDAVDISSMEEACETLYASKKYMLTRLTKGCHIYIKSHLCPSNVISVYEFVEEIGESELIEPCLILLGKYTESILLHPQEHMKPTTMTMILKQNNLNITEPHLFRGVVQWAEKECEIRGLVATSSNCRSILVDIEAFSLIRFLVFTAKDFLDGPYRSDILTVDESHALWDNILLKQSPMEEFTDMSIPIEYQCFYMPKKCVELPNGLSENTECRQHMPVRQYYCVRKFLKTSRILRGCLKILTKLTVSKVVILNGVRFFARMVPVRMLSPSLLRSHVSKRYMENMQIRVFDEDNSILSQTVFLEEVEYGTMATAHFGDPIMLIPGKEYSIYMESLSVNHPPNQYPAGFLDQSEVSRGVLFNFCDYGHTGRDGSLVQRLDMGFIDALVYSHA